MTDLVESRVFTFNPAETSRLREWWFDHLPTIPLLEDEDEVQS